MILAGGAAEASAGLFDFDLAPWFRWLRVELLGLPVRGDGKFTLYDSSCWTSWSRGDDGRAPLQVVGW